MNENKKQFIALLLLADEQENMIDHYLAPVLAVKPFFGGNA